VELQETRVSMTWKIWPGPTGTKRKLRNWNGTQIFQLVITVVPQSCRSFAGTRS